MVLSFLNVDYRGSGVLCALKVVYPSETHHESVKVK